MVETKVNRYPLTLVVNFWETRPAQMGKRLDELRRRGVTRFASFVPWQFVEADVTHSLSRFLQAVADRDMKVQLILTPEVGVHYPYSGLPKDVMTQKENEAADSELKKIPVLLPPGIFYLPSLFSQDVKKRVVSFFARMDSFFCDLSKHQPKIFEHLEIVLTGSFWKYYRSPRFSAQAVFGGEAGDYSGHGTLSYRETLEAYFSQKEFSDPTPAAANRWKTRSLEEVNRRWFYQQAEEKDRARNVRMLHRRGTDLPLCEIELFTPEADPSLVYASLLQMTAGGYAPFSKLSTLLDEVMLRCSRGATVPAIPAIHWTSMGNFRLLSEGEKQFLVLKSLLLTAGQKGGVLIDESDWFALSASFRHRFESLADHFHGGEFQSKNRVAYFTSHLWSGGGALLRELKGKVSQGFKIVSSMEVVLSAESTKLLVVDPTCLLTRDLVQKLSAWVQVGRTLVLPRSPLYSEWGKAELERVLHRTKKFEIDLGMDYQIHALGEGKLILYDGFAVMDGPQSTLVGFIDAVLAIADIDQDCSIQDARLTAVSFARKTGETAVFILNGSATSVTGEIVFPCDVMISDLGAILSGTDLGTNDDSDELRTFDEQKGEGAQDAPDSQGARRFALEVPPFGVLPLSVTGLSVEDDRERRLASLQAQATRESAMQVAFSELPGLTELSGMANLFPSGHDDKHHDKMDYGREGQSEWN